MPKYYCDYCDIYLTHDSPSVRKAHNSGWKHINAVKSYYSELGQDKAQEIIDGITTAYGARSMALPSIFSVAGAYAPIGMAPRPNLSLNNITGVRTNPHMVMNNPRPPMRPPMGMLPHGRPTFQNMSASFNNNMNTPPRPSFGPSNMSFQPNVNSASASFSNFSSTHSTGDQTTHNAHSLPSSSPQSKSNALPPSGLPFPFPSSGQNGLPPPPPGFPGLSLPPGMPPLPPGFKFPPGMPPFPGMPNNSHLAPPNSASDQDANTKRSYEDEEDEFESKRTKIERRN